MAASATSCAATSFDLTAQYAESVTGVPEILAVIDQALQLVNTELSASPAQLTSPGLADMDYANGALSLVSQDGKATAQASAFNSDRLRWLSTSTIVNTNTGLFANRLLGLAPPGTLVPHLNLGHKVEGGKVQVTASLLPRRSLLLHTDDLQRYLGTAPAEGLPAFNDLLKDCLGREGWHVFTSGMPRARLLLDAAATIPFTFAPTKENLEAWHMHALDITRLWLALVRADAGGVDDAEVARYDTAYVGELDAVTAMVAGWLFNQQEGTALVEAITGSRQPS